MRHFTSLVAAGLFLLVGGCAKGNPAPAAPAPGVSAPSCPCGAATTEAGSGRPYEAANCPRAVGGGPAGMGAMGNGPMMGDGPMMGNGPMGPRMGAPAPAGSAQGAPISTPLSQDAKAALLRALDEEYRAEALYASIVSKVGARPPFQPITRSEHRHAWILESLAIAHGIELPTNTWTTAKQPEVGNLGAGCRAGVESEKKTIALYDELLKTDLPQDLRRAFEHLRAASAQRHLPAFEACR